ncbi:CDF-like metal transporter [Flagelloscypha sp. PMI_526]|nr:CDF-like metal transporter [Flagelloscypha sp. PMI_526]
MLDVHNWISFIVSEPQHLSPLTIVADSAAVALSLNNGPRQTERNWSESLPPKILDLGRNHQDIRDPLPPTPASPPRLAISTNALSVGDPYGLSNGIKTSEELSALRKRKAGKKLTKYYEKQNELIESSLKPMAQMTEEGREAVLQARSRVQIAIYASLFANISLSILQLYAAISSLSLSFFAAALDSVFDPASNFILNYLHQKGQRLDKNKWPVGGNRLETVGNVVYGNLMAAVNLVIIVESIRSIIERTSGGGGGETNDLHVPSVVAVAAALGTKMLLFFFCLHIRKSSSQVQMLWEDHRNDIAVCSFGLLTSTGGAKLKWWIDPMGAIILGTTNTLLWSYRIYREFELLSGKSASHEFIQMITYKALTFDAQVQGVDTVRAYHSGPKYFVEVDLIFSPDLSLRRAHDLGELLQDEIEVLPNVERAFVHLDWEGRHAIEHNNSMMTGKRSHNGHEV